MQLRIEYDTTIKDVQREFNAFYPYLKIEFFENSDAEYNAEPKLRRISGNKVVAEISKFNASGRIDMDGKRTVSQIENDFHEAFGLSVQVFRKSGNLWIETTLTDSWTLDKQNQEGEFLNQQSLKSFEQRVDDGLIDAD